MRGLAGAAAAGSAGRAGRLLHLRPDDRPQVAEVALFLARARGLHVRPDLAAALRAMEQAMGPDTNPDALLAATVAHLAVSGSAA
ncbi:MAG: hypothetical protein ACRD0K_30615 [Egibacteraceae bacterium]